MGTLPNGSSQTRNCGSAFGRSFSFLVLLLVVLDFLHPQPSYSNEYAALSALKNDDVVQRIVNPFDSDCYDWRGKHIPCDIEQPCGELFLYKSNSDVRFTDNSDGTVTDNFTKLVWLKNVNCFGMMDWQSAVSTARRLEDGDCGPDPALILSDGSSAGDWRLPTMKELCTLIDFRRREPALPSGHMFSDVPPGYHWSATTLDYHPDIAWIVYFESGTTCYEGGNNRAGYVLPVRLLK